MPVDVGNSSTKELPVGSEGCGSADSGVSGATSLLSRCISEGVRMVSKVRKMIGIRVESVSSALKKNPEKFCSR